MARSNEDILTALKSIIEVNDLGESILSPGQLDRFVEAMQARTAILQEARYMPMRSQQENIDRVGFTGRIVHGTKTPATGAHRDLATTEYAKPATNTNKLIANELKAIVPLRDKALRRNIERGGFQAHIVDLMGNAAGLDFEEYGLFADTELFTVETDDTLCLTDGWLNKAANKVYGTGAGAGFDPDDPEAVFEALIGAVPKEFLTNPAEWRIYVDWATGNAYRDVLRARNTGLGDVAQIGNQPIPYKGFPVVVVPMFERALAAADGGVGRVAMLQYPTNMVWGVFDEVGVESQRDALGGITYQVLTVECDADYEDENGAAVAYLDLEDPAAS